MQANNHKEQTAWQQWQSANKNHKRETISSFLFRESREKAVKKIEKITQQDWYCIISYVYFAQAMSYRLYEERGEEKHKQYFHGLQQSHLVCIDGIAMQIFDRCGGKMWWQRRPRSTSINGTDFMPYFLDTISKKKKVWVIILTVYDESIGKWPERWPIIRSKFIERFPHVDIILFDFVHYRQRWENNIEQTIDATLSEKRNNYDDIIVINGRGGPLQEIRSAEHASLRKKYHCIVMNQWATLDFISGFEKRVPSRVVRLRVGETLWRIVAQPRNLKKLFAMFSIVRYRHFVLKTLAKRLFSL